MLIILSGHRRENWLSDKLSFATGEDFLLLHVRYEKMIPSQMEVAPLHRTVDISHKRRLFKNTKEIEKM